MIEILCGPIGCGKSSYAAKRAKQGAIVVNDDNIVIAMHGGDYSLYDPKLKFLYKSLENHAIILAIAAGRDVVIDRPNYSKQTRARYISLAKSLDRTVKLILWPWKSPSESAMDRTMKDGRGHTYQHWLDAANRHFSQYEPPSLDEGIDEIVEW